MQFGPDGIHGARLRFYQVYARPGIRRIGESRVHRRVQQQEGPAANVAFHHALDLPHLFSKQRLNPVGMRLKLCRSDAFFRKEGIDAGGQGFRKRDALDRQPSEIGGNGGIEVGELTSDKMADRRGPAAVDVEQQNQGDENQNQERRHAGEKSKQPALQGRPLMALLLPERQCLSEHRQAIRLLSPINPLLSYFSKGGFRPRVPAVQISFPP